MSRRNFRDSFAGFVSVFGVKFKGSKVFVKERIPESLDHNDRITLGEKDILFLRYKLSMLRLSYFQSHFSPSDVFNPYAHFLQTKFEAKFPSL